MDKPPLLQVISAIILAVYVSYDFYEIWFQPKKYLQRMRKRAYKIPRWVPFRWFAIDEWDNPNHWKTYNRIIVIFAEIIVILLLAIVLTAWFIGQ